MTPTENESTTMANAMTTRMSYRERSFPAKGVTNVVPTK